MYRFVIGDSSPLYPVPLKRFRSPRLPGIALQQFVEHSVWDDKDIKHLAQQMERIELFTIRWHLS